MATKHSSADSSRSVVPEEDEECNQLLIEPAASIAAVPATSPRWRFAVLAVAAAVALLAGGLLSVAFAHPRHPMATHSTSSTSDAAFDALSLWAFNRGNVVCGFSLCDCSWATGGMDGTCALRANDQTTCWRCCCQSYFEDDYNRIMAERRWTYRHSSGRYYGGEEDEYEHAHIHEGDWVLVQTPNEEWKYAAVIDHEGPYRLRVRFLDDDRVDVVPRDRVVLMDNAPWYWYCFMGLFWICVIVACAGCIGLLTRQLRKPRAQGQDGFLFAGRVK